MSKYVVQAGWSDAAHLSEDSKADLIRSYPVQERDARTRGVPQLGSGAIYPIPESEIVVDPFEIPPHYRRSYGLDVGWNRTAGIWSAHDADTDILYLYSEYYRGNEEPAVHAQGIRARGEWIPGVIDPAARGRSQHDGQQLLASYRDLGLNLTIADNGVETGIFEVYRRLSEGRLKVFRTLMNWRMEYRTYQRDKKGAIQKRADHLMDACITGETTVVTPEGSIPIRDLVGRRGKVMTRDGAWASFIGARRVFENVPTVTVRFSDGRNVRCTPDHPFLTPDGWVRADCMRYRTCYDCVSQRIQWEPLCRPSFYLHAVSSFVGFAISCLESIFEPRQRAAAGSCTGMSGPSTMTGVGFLPVCRSTTLTMIPRTTNQKIWFSWDNLNTCNTTTQVTSEASRRQPLKLLPRGIAVKLGSLGTENITRNAVRLCIRSARSFASSAARRTRLRSPETIGSARMPASPSSAGYLGLMMSNVSAWLAAACFGKIATAKRRRAAGNVLPTCLVVELAEPADVFCLTVPGISAFGIEGGIVVHNTRYNVRSGIEVACYAPIKDWNIGRPKSHHSADFDPFGDFNKTAGHSVDHDTFAEATRWAATR